MIGENQIASFGNILVVDDDVEMQVLLKEYLRPHGHTVMTFSSATEVLDQLQSGLTADLIISDFNMPNMDGMKFMERLREERFQIPFVIMTAYGSIESAVKAIQAGASDYLPKPFTRETLQVLVQRLLNKRNIEMPDLSNGAASFGVGDMIGRSPQMKNIFHLVRRVAKSSANVLILGESGTGKDMVAKALHSQSSRAKHPFIAINCAAIPEALLESELFGHAKGSFTGALTQKRGLLEEANGGTFFLDEIADMQISLQAKLLRVIQDRKIKPVGQNTFRDIDIRIVAATHKNLVSMISNGQFREDLYYRLSVIPIALPALRERPEDIGLFAEHFFKKYKKLNEATVKGFSQEAFNKIMAMPWEGNVRQLENTIERAVILCEDPYIGVHHIYQAHPPATVEDSLEKPNIIALSITDMEKRCIEAALEKTRGRKECAAKLLGISRKTLYRKEREYGLAN